MNYGATIQAGIRMPLDKEMNFQAIGGMGEGSFGARIIYFDPVNVGKFYFGVSEVYRGQKNDFQNQDLILKKAAENFVVGAEIKVSEGEIVNLEVAKGNLDWGESLSVKGGLAGVKLKGEIGYEKKTS